MIHSSAIISNDAEIAEGVEIGPFSVIKGKVKIGSGTVVENNVTIGCDTGVVEIGENNHFAPGSVIGGPPQDLSYRGEPTKLIFGNGNSVREFVTVNLGTKKDKGETIIGNDCLLMAYVHIAHDCVIHDRVVIANSTHFAGHVHVEDDVKIGGVCAISQFIRIGRHAYIGGDSAINKDILPYAIAQGKYAVMRATNKIGIERAGYEKDEIENIHKALRAVIKGNRTIEEALEKIAEDCKPTDNVTHFVEFIKNSKLGLAR